MGPVPVSIIDVWDWSQRDILYGWDQINTVFIWSQKLKMPLWDQSQTSIMETGTSPRELFWASGTGPREQSGLRIIVSHYQVIILVIARTPVVVSAMLERRQVVSVSLWSVDSHPPLTEHASSDVQH